MKSRIFTIISLLLILILTLHFGTLNAIADFGNFSGDSDYGSSSGGGYSGGSDYSSSGSGWNSSGGGDLSFADFIMTLFFMLIIIFVMVMIEKIKPSGARRPRPAGATPTDPSKLRSISEYRLRDTNFSEPELQEKISNLYVQMQNCWTAKNMESLRPYFTDTAYAQFDRQLDSYRKNCRTNYVERISVLDVSLLGWYEQKNNDCMVANVRARIVDYTKDDKTGNIISGSATTEKFMTYEYILVRSSDYVTNAQDKDIKTLNCPNCGASLDINHSAECPYCGSIITAKSYDWAISSIKGISQTAR
jgi:predicted lipid-binding transport protein (Tim44 family)/DNA-directed RNA polymerase subunit RPC12/RpoP